MNILMGLESYLFRIIFQVPPSIGVAVNLIEVAGMNYLKERSKEQSESDYGNYFFELRDKKGLIEAHIITSPGETIVDEFSLRFSILSPMAVVELTFDFLKNLNEIAPIEIYDTEIRNHIYRQLRRSGKVDINFEGLNIEHDEAIDKLCLISLSADDFRRNELEIMKRQTVLENKEGQIVEGGSATFNVIAKKGLFERFLGWIKKEL